MSACLVLAARATVSSPDIASPDIDSTRRSGRLPADPSSSPPPHQALRLRRKCGVIIVISPGQIGQVKAMVFIVFQTVFIVLTSLVLGFLAARPRLLSEYSSPKRELLQQ